MTNLGPFIQLVLDERASFFPNGEVGLRLLRVPESEGFAGREGGLRLGELVGQLLVCGDEGSDVGSLYRSRESVDGLQSLCDDSLELTEFGC